MRAVSFLRLPLLAAFLALLLLAWVLFYWISALLVPRQQIAPTSVSTPSLSKVLAESIVALHLFGADSSANVGVESATIAAPSNFGVQGIYASRDGHSGFAVLLVDGKPIPAVVGEEFAPGMVLQRAYPDYVEILRGGQLNTVRMLAAVTAPKSRPIASSILKGGSVALQMAVHQLGPGQYLLSREEMLATMQRPDQTHLLGQYTPNPLGGAMLEQSPAGGLPEKLGLKVGDVITRINRKTISGPDAVERLNEQLTNSENVEMVVMRAGNKINIGIQVEQQ